jgi:hypothetical protein
MSGYIEIKNFKRFQHYKERNPLWIKLYYETLDDYEFACLPDASKWLLVGLWMLASRTENKIPHDVTWIAKKLALTERVKLDPLLSAGFITIHAASNALAGRYQDATPEKETEKETDSVSEADVLFEVAWQAYPRKPNNPRKAAKAGWDARIREGVDPRDLLSAVDRYAAFCKATKTQARYVMMGATFFGPNERWKDSFEIEDQHGRRRDGAGGADQGAGGPKRGKYDHLTVVSGAEPAA